MSAAARQGGGRPATLRHAFCGRIVELSFMPKALAGCSDSCSAAAAKSGSCTPCRAQFGDGGSYKSVAQPPADYEDWYNLIHALATHMVER